MLESCYLHYRRKPYAATTFKQGAEFTILAVYLNPKRTLRSSLRSFEFDRHVYVIQKRVSFLPTIMPVTSTLLISIIVTTVETKNANATRCIYTPAPCPIVDNPGTIRGPSKG